MEKSNAAAATVQHVTRSSSDELLRKFAEVGGSLSEDRRQLRLVKRLKRRELALFAAAGARRRSSSIYCGREAANGSGATVVERKSLLSPPAYKRPTPHFGIGKVRVRARELNNRSFVATLVKTWRKTVEGASKIFLEKQKHYNQHKRLINSDDIY
ncbi:unnamed protein product [Cuscuta europaea]|uniref:Uncharacterized protein n=1 Tax=Cuscuta europaea TaxID=41803 RepID=A0A9P1EJ24_CUSEU|nr:unnamed protein product [Cuscuta europaea]